MSRAARVVIGVTALFLLIISIAGAASGPRIGSSQASVDRGWRRDGAPCIGGICGYKVVYRQPLWIQVEYSHSQAISFQLGFDPDRFSSSGPSPAPKAYWNLLTSLLPSGARRTACRYIRKTGGNEGPASACMYGYHGKHILVAHYVTANSNLDIGRVALNEDFSWIEAAR